MDWLKIVVASLMRQIEKLNKKKADRSEIAKPDWTINDPNDPRYIEGRTHYVVETNDRAIFKDVTVESTWNRMNGYYAASVSSTFYDHYFDSTTKYVVIWDGVEYRDVVSKFGATSSGYGGPYYNDGSGYVFWFVQDGEYLDVACSEGTHTFSLFEQDVKSREYVTIPEEYLPTPVGKAGTGEHAEVFNGNDSEVASGVYSHAEGRNAVASGACSHAEGDATKATGSASHVEGSYTEASASHSHAEGCSTVASGGTSHAEGHYTIAAGHYQHVQGKYNVSDAFGVSGKYAHIVGNGTSSNKRSNAHTVDWNGLGWFAGGLKVGGTGQDDEAAVEVALKTDIPDGLPEGATAHQQLVTDADGNTTWEERLGYNELSYIEHAEVSVGIYNLGYANLPYELFLANGEQYAINWDGTEYTCTAAITTVDEEEVMVIGNTTFFGGSANTDIPVGIISRSGRATVYSNTSGEHTIGLTGYEPIPHKIPREYIDLNPIVGVIDSSYYNYRYLNPARGASITEVRKAAVNGDRDIIIRLDLDNWQGTLKYMGLTNVSTDGTNYVSALLFSTIKANNVTINASDEIVNGTMQLEYWYALLEPTEGPPADAFINFQFAEINLAPGASRAGYYMRVNEDGFWEATEGPTNVSELANDADYISAPATATVGQTIVVKSVDENGKPTEWEAADVGGGLPEGAIAHQQLVTDANGNTAWEDKLAYAYNSETVIMPETVCEFVGDSSYWNNAELPTFTLELDKEYKVMWDGTAYTCVGVTDGESGVMLGNSSLLGSSSDTGEPFAIFYNPSNGVSACSATSGNHMFSIGGIEETVKTIDPKYLPDDVILAPEGSQTHQQLVTDADGVVKWEERTHYSDSVVIEWDGNTEGRTVFGEDYPLIVHVSDKVLTAEQCVGASLNFMNKVNRVSESEVVTVQSGVVFVMSGGTQVIAIVPNDNTINTKYWDVTFPKAGVYFQAFTPEVRPVSLSTETVKTIDPKYLPRNSSNRILLIDAYEDGATMTGAEIVEAVDGGDSFAFLRYDALTILPYVGYHDQSAIFSGACISDSGTPSVFTVTVNETGGVITNLTELSIKSSPA